MAASVRQRAHAGRGDPAGASTRPGFSLVEVLVVVAILALLAAILFPIAASARDASRRSVCLSNLRQIALAHLMYVQDNDDTLPF
jgi:prepilin-type N-terminal cleavage/methylation domain-containing protein